MADAQPASSSDLRSEPSSDEHSDADRGEAVPPELAARYEALQTAFEQAQRTHRRERDVLAAVAEISHTHLAYLDPEFNFVWVNAAYAEGSGHTREQLVGRNHFDLFPNAENEAIFTRVRDTGIPIQFEAKPFEYVDQPERGITYWDWSLVPDRDCAGQVQGLVFSLQEVTKRKQAEAERERLLDELAELNLTLEKRVRERTAQVQALSAALALAEQRERRRIAEVLHNDLQQFLYSELMRLQILQRRLVAAGEPNAQTLVDGMTGLMHRAIDVSRALLVELDVPVFNTDGLDEALGWLAGHMEQIHGLKVQFVKECVARIPDHCQRGLLLQTAHELLFNVLKHAGVQEARLGLYQESGCIVIRVEDDGAGFDLETMHARQREQGGLALFSIAEWLALVGGRLEVESAPGAGTRVTVVIPAEATGGNGA